VGAGLPGGGVLVKVCILGGRTAEDCLAVSAPTIDHGPWGRPHQIGGYFIGMHQNAVDYPGFASVEGYAAIPPSVVVRVYPYVVTGVPHFVTFCHTMVRMGRRRGM
jgi:hypothetical protein